MQKTQFSFSVALTCTVMTRSITHTNVYQERTTRFLII